jgi:DNA-binding transcriptional MerR regulator
MEKSLPAIPAKRYFTIGEVSDLCGVKPYVLRYWEQEFTQLKPMKRRGNRRYYQHHEVLLIRRIRDLLYDQGFTISGARNRLAEGAAAQRAQGMDSTASDDGLAMLDAEDDGAPVVIDTHSSNGADLPALRSHEVLPGLQVLEVDLRGLRAELLSIRAMLVEAV